MMGTYLIAVSKDSKHVHMKKRGELVKNGDYWFGITREKPSKEAKSEWRITELSTGLKAYNVPIRSKAEAVEKAKSAEFLESVERIFNCEETNLSYSQIERIKEGFAKNREECYAAYCDKEHDGDVELAKTFRRIFQ